MKFWHVMVLLGALLVGLGGCGGGDSGKVGNLTLTVTKEAQAGGQFAVSALAAYTNPNQTNLVGTEITFDTSPQLPGFPVKKTTPTNGIVGINFAINQDTAPQNFFIIARTGGLEDSKPVSIPALSAVVPSSSTITFSNTQLSQSTQSLSITGGTAPYTASSDNASLVTATVSGSTVIITRVSDNPGSATVTVRDANGASAAVLVTLQ